MSAELVTMLRTTLPAEMDDVVALVECAIGDLAHPASRLCAWEWLAERAAARAELAAAELAAELQPPLPLAAW